MLTRQRDAGVGLENQPGLLLLCRFVSLSALGTWAWRSVAGLPLGMCRSGPQIGGSGEMEEEYVGEKPVNP